MVQNICRKSNVQNIYILTKSLWWNCWGVTKLDRPTGWPQSCDLQARL